MTNPSSKTVGERPTWEEYGKSEQRGFTQGVAWAVAILDKWHCGSDQMLQESGLELADFVDAQTDESDMKVVKRLLEEK